MPGRVTIGALPFLNARPLICGLAEEREVRLRIEVPSALGPLLRTGEVDAALVPSIEYFRLASEGGERARGGAAGRGGVVALPVAAIASRGTVGSVRLFGYAEPNKLRRVLLDSASRTANALGRLVVIRRLGSRPHFLLPEEVSPAPPRPPDAELLIGDRGLVAERPQAAWTLDLGEEWREWTHLPFVYAFWAARVGSPVGRLIEMLTAARDRGLKAREALAAEAAPTLGLDADAARRYLMDEIRYEFGPKEQDGLRAFYRMAAEEGLAPEGVRLRFARAGAPV